MPTDVQPRIALLIDADNAPAEMIDEILTELSTFGVINIRRAYGNWTKSGLHGWQNKLLEYAIRPMQQFDYSKGKNATDMTMTVDAMELLYTEKPDAFGIVSSDADFTPLVMHLRAKGVQVYGFGADQTPKAFVNACSRFLYLESLGGPQEVSIAEENTNCAVPTTELDLVLEEKQPEKTTNKAQEAPKTAATGRIQTAQLRQNTRLMNLLRSAVQALQDDAGWVPVSALRTQIGNKASFDPRNYGYATLTKLLVAVEDFEFKNEGTSLVAVRAKKETSAARSSASHGVVSWSVTQPRQSGKKLPPSIFALRSVLLQIAAARVSLVDILRAVPEMALGQTCSLAAVAGRLRERGLLLPTQSALRVLEKHPSSFVVDLKTMPQSVRYLMSWE